MGQAHPQAIKQFGPNYMKAKFITYRKLLYSLLVFVLSVSFWWFSIKDDRVIIGSSWRVAADRPESAHVSDVWESRARTASNKSVFVKLVLEPVKQFLRTKFQYQTNCFVLKNKGNSTFVGPISQDMRACVTLASVELVSRVFDPKDCHPYAWSNPCFPGLTKNPLLYYFSVPSLIWLALPESFFTETETPSYYY